jgi:UDP-N-acetylglucosamine 1-carboxyvinyltransferase
MIKQKVKAYKIKGRKVIRGEINCSGAKNLISQAMIGAILANGQSVFTNCPSIGDVEITCKMLQSIGVEVILDKENEVVKVDPSNINSPKVINVLNEAGQQVINRMPILIMGALLNKFNKVTVPNLGGCKIGERSLDIHFEFMEKLGIEITITDEFIIATKRREIENIEFEFSFPSVGATQNAIYLLAYSNGKSLIKNVAIEPEVGELVKMFKAMGLSIELNMKKRELIISGCKDDLKCVNFEILGDRVEAASLACLACATNGDLTIHKIFPETLSKFLEAYQEIGGGYEILNENSIRFFRQNKLEVKSNFCLKSEIWPGFSTDWMQPFSILLVLGEEEATLHETVFENRFQYLEQLKILGVESKILKTCPENDKCRFYGKNFPHTAILGRKNKFIYGNEQDLIILDASDLRAGFTFLIAAAISEGVTYITNVEIIERGYGDIAFKLNSIGMSIEKLFI